MCGHFQILYIRKIFCGLSILKHCIVIWQKNLSHIFLFSYFNLRGEIPSGGDFNYYFVGGFIDSWACVGLYATYPLIMYIQTSSTMSYLTVRIFLVPFLFDTQLWSQIGTQAPKTYIGMCSSFLTTVWYLMWLIWTISRKTATRLAKLEVILTM